MQVAEDTGPAGVAGQDAPGAPGTGGVRGIQEGERGGAPAPGVQAAGVQGHGVQGGGGEVGGPVQGADGVAGFLSEEWVPRRYQVRGIDWLLRPEAALFLPPGLGKSSIALEAIRRLKEMGFPHRTLLLAPKTVCLTTWMTEPKKWRQFQGLRVGL